MSPRLIKSCMSFSKHTCIDLNFFSLIYKFKLRYLINQIMFFWKRFFILPLTKNSCNNVRGLDDQLGNGRAKNIAYIIKIVLASRWTRDWLAYIVSLHVAFVSLMNMLVHVGFSTRTARIFVYYWSVPITSTSTMYNVRTGKRPCKTMSRSGTIPRKKMV